VKNQLAMDELARLVEEDLDWKVVLLEVGFGIWLASSRDRDEGVAMRRGALVVGSEAL